MIRILFPLMGFAFTLTRAKMEQQGSSLRSFVWLILLFDLVLRVAGNAEGDALTELKKSLFDDPNNVLQSWDATLVSPCTWFHVTCNPENRVIRVDLGNANLSGQLVAQLGQLPNLQYLELYSNNITGGIPEELGGLRELVSLDLYMNNLSGPIPSSLGKLEKLQFLRLNNNNLSGEIPRSLTAVSLQVLDVSNNRLNGDIPVNGSFSLFTPISFANNSLRPLPESPPTSVSPPPPSSSGGQTTAAIAIGAAAGAAVLFAGPAIALAWWLRSKPHDHFVDVPGEEDPEVHLGQLRRFTLRELLVATDNFSNKNVLGRGGFGKVYKGRLASGSLVAVKRLKEERTTGDEDMGPNPEPEPPVPIVRRGPTTRSGTKVLREQFNRTVEHLLNSKRLGRTLSDQLHGQNEQSPGPGLRDDQAEPGPDMVSEEKAAPGPDMTTPPTPPYDIQDGPISYTSGLKGLTIFTCLPKPEGHPQNAALH